MSSPSRRKIVPGVVAFAYSTGKPQNPQHQPFTLGGVEFDRRGTVGRQMVSGGVEITLQSKAERDAKCTLFHRSERWRQGETKSLNLNIVVALSEKLNETCDRIRGACCPV